MSNKITKKQLYEIAEHTKKSLKENLNLTDEEELNQDTEEINPIDKKENDEQPQEILNCVQALQQANEELMKAKANVKDEEHKDSIAKLRRKISRIWDEVVDKYDIVK